MNNWHFFDLQHTRTCCVCNGYYGPSFDEPLCGTCHAFLFPFIEEIRSTELSDNDDEDSGNDEPPYKELQRDIAVGHAANNNDPAEENNENQEELFDEAPVRRPNLEEVLPDITIDETRPEPIPPRNLRHYLDALAEHHEIFSNIRNIQPSNIVNNASTSKATDTIAALPVEVLLKIFSYMDDISLSSVSQVCKQWHSILEAHTPQSLWQRYTKARFPLYHQITRTNNWFKVFMTLTQFFI